MSKDIENKVVSMEFDNSKFEKPAEQTMSTLDRLKKALNFKGVSDGFDAMQKGIKAVTFAPIEKGIDSVYAKFTFMERFTIQLYDRIANKIISTGHMIASETFTRPISTGKAEYEEKMGAVQTIMASSKKSLSEVNDILAELNKYADDTIYSFKDMTTSIGKFTNAGVDLKDAVAAIKGISNEAALSGANANEASRAMYNFAQALSSGSVKLIDWKSIENANMATKEFKEELIETAVALGKLTKQTDGYYRTTQGKTFTATAKFNDALQDQWMTSEVLIETLKKYSDETTDVGKRANAAAKEVKTFSMLIDTLKEALQSGWSESWENIIGNFEEAKALWTSVSGVLGGLIDRMSQARNSLLGFWKDYGGRTSMLKAMSNIWQSLTKILGAVRDGFRNVFPPMTGRRLVEITNAFERFTKKLIPSNDTVNKLRSTFKGFFSILGIGVDAVKALFKVLSPLFGKLLGFASGEILKSTSSLGEWIFKLRQTIKEGQVFERIFGKLGSVLSALGRALKAVYVYIRDVAVAFRDGGFKAGFEAIKNGFVDMLTYIWNLIKKFNPIQAIKNLGKKIADAISQWPIGQSIVRMVTKVKNAIAGSPVWKFCVSVVEGFVNTIQKIINKFRHVDTSATEEFTDNVKKGFGPLEAVKKFFVAIWNGINAVWSVIGPTLKAIGRQIGTAFTNLFNGIKGVVDRSDLGDAGVFGAGAGLGLLTASLAKFAWDLGKTVKGTADAINGFRKLMDGVVGLLKGLKFEAYARSLKDIGIAIALLAGSMWLLATLPADAIMRATAAIMFLFRGLSTAMNSFSAIKTITDGKAGAAVGLLSIGAQLMMMAAAVTILVADLAILAALPYGALVKGFAMLILMLRAISHEAIKLTTEGGSNGKAALAMVAMGVMIQLMTAPLLVLGALAALNFRSMVITVGGIIAVIAVMTECYLAVIKASKDAKGFKGAGFAATIAAMGVAIIAIVVAIAGLSVIAAVVAKMFKAEDALGQATEAVVAILWRLMVFAGVIIVLSKFLNRFKKFSDNYATSTNLNVGGKFSFNRSGQAGNGIFGAFFPVIGTMIGIGVAMVAIAGAVGVMSVAAAKLTSTKFDAVMKSIYDLVTLLGIFSVVVALVSRIGAKGGSKFSLSLFPSLAAYIFAAAAFVVSVAAAAKIMHSVDERDLWWTMGIIASLFAAIAALSVASVFPGFAKGLTVVAKAFVLFGKAAMYLGIGVGIIVAALALLTKATGGEVDKMADNLDKLVEAIKRRKDSIVDAIATLVQTVIESIVIGAGRAVTTMLKEIVKILNDVFDQIIFEGPQLFNKLWTVVCMVLDSIIDNAPEVTEKLVKAIVEVIKGVAAAIDKHSTEIIEAINQLVESVLKVIIGTFARLFGVTKAELDDFVNKLMPTAKKITTILIGIWAVSKIKKASDAVLKIFTSFSDKLSAIAASWVKVGGLKGKIFGYSFETTETQKEIVRAKDYFKTAEELKKWISEKKGRSGGSFVSVDNTVTTLHTVPGLIDTIKDKASGLFGKITGFVKAHPVLLAVTAVGLGLAAVLKYATKNMEVLGKYDKKDSEIHAKMQKREEDYEEAIKNRQAAMENANSSAATYERTAEQLDEIIDAEGRVKAGHEKEFESLTKILGAVVEIKIGEDGRVKIIQDENTQLDYQKTKLNDILKLKQQQNRLDALSSEYNSALEKSRSGELAAEAGAAEKAYKEFANQQINVPWADSWLSSAMTNEQFAEAYEKFITLRAKGMADVDALISSGLADERARENLTGQNLSHYLNDINSVWKEMGSHFQTLREDMDQTAILWAKNTAFITQYEDALKKIANGEDATAVLDAIGRGDITSGAANAMLNDKQRMYTLSTQLDTMLSRYAEESQKLAQTETKMTDERIEYYKTALNSLANEATAGGVDVNKIFASYGASSVESFMQAFQKKMKSYKLVTIYENATDKKNNRALAWDVVAEEDMAGYIKGLDKYGKNVVTSVRDVAQSALDGWTDVHKIESPSKVFEQFGIYDMLGLIKGVEGETSDVEKAFNAVAAASVAAYNSAMNSGNSFAWAPLIDTTGIQNGTAAIQGQLSSLQTSPIATSMTSKLAASVDTSSLDIDNERIITSMTYIYDELASLKDTMANLQVVMDSGLLVGALAPGMDMELGRRTVRKGRGV